MPTKPPAWKAAPHLEELLDREGWSQARLAEAMGVDDSTVSRWCSGARAPGPDTLVRISRVTGLSVDEILGLPTDGEWPSHELARTRLMLRRVRQATEIDGVVKRGGDR